MMFKRLRSEDIRKRGFVLDGFPRTKRQAEALTLELAKLDVSLNAVFSLEMPDEEVVRRLSGRLGCTKCGEIYHSSTKPPKREGICDRCNGPLFVREDDKPGTILERLRVFRESTAPVVDYYAGTGELVRIDANRSADDVFGDLEKVLKGEPSG